LIYCSCQKTEINVQDALKSKNYFISQKRNVKNSGAASVELLTAPLLTACS
jgi:hypothetical protein